MKQLAAIITLTLLLVACNGSNGNVVKDDTIKIGFIGPLTGSEAVLGEQLRNGVDLAFGQISAEDTRYTYEIIYEDDQIDNKLTASAYHKLKNVDNVDAIVGVSSGSGHVLAPLADPDKTITCIAAASDINVVKDRNYIFKHWVTPEAQSEKFIEEARELGWTRLALLEANQQGVKAIGDEVEATASGIQVERVVVDPKAKDFRTELLKIQRNPPDAIVVLVFPSQIIPLVQQVRELGIDLPLPSIEMYDYLTEGFDMIEGEWYVTTARPTAGYASAFRAQYGKESTGISPHGYDCLQLIVKGFEEGGHDPDAAMNVLRQLDNYRGAAGTLRYNAGSIEGPAEKYTIRDGEMTAE